MSEAGEVKQLQPVRQEPPLPQGDGQTAEKREPPKNLQQEEQAKKIQEQREQRREKIKENAQKELSSLQEKTKDEAAVQKVQQEVEQASIDPERNHIDFVINKGEVPADKDLLLISKKIINDAQREPSLATNEAKLAEYINLVEVATQGKPPEAQDELKRWKARLVRQLGKTVVEKTKKADPQKTDFLEQTEEYWRNKTTDGEIAPEEFVELVEHRIKPIRGGQGETEEAWTVWDEQDSRFQSFPPELQKLIRDINDTSRFAPSTYGSHYVEAKIQDLERLNGQVPREVKNEIRQRLNNSLVKKTKEARVVERSQRTTPYETAKLAKEEKETKDGIDQLRQELLQPAYMQEVDAGKRSDVLRNLITQAAAQVNEADFLESQAQAISAIENSLNEADKELANRAKNLLSLRSNFIKSQESYNPYERSLESQYRQVGFTDEDINFIETDLDSWQRILEYVQKNGYKDFDRRLTEIYSKLFRSATRSTRSFFDHNWDIFIQKPVYEHINSKIEIARQYFEQHPGIEGGHHLGRVEEFDKIKKKRVERDIHLSEALHQLKLKAEMRHEFTEYTHNVYVILQTRGELKDLAGYSERIKSHDLELLFLGESLLPSVVHIYEQELTRSLAAKNWEITPELFTEDVNGEIEIERHVKEIVSGLTDNEGKKYGVLDIERAISEARGMVLGITAIAIDRLAEARPPTPKTDRFAASYFGEKILSAWNPMYHSTIRWSSISGKNYDILYAQAFQKGRFVPWDNTSLTRVKNNFNSESKVSFNYEGMAGLPIIHVANLFGLSGLFARGGWRVTEATDYLMVDKNGNMLKDNMGQVKYSDVDWSKSWENLKQGGTSLLYYWIDKRAETEAKYPQEKQELEALKNKYESLKKTAVDAGKIGLTPDQENAQEQEKKKITEKYKAYHDQVVQERRIQLKKEIFEMVRDRNPLKFTYFDKEDVYSPKSLRERAYFKAFGQKSPFTRGKNEKGELIEEEGKSNLDAKQFEKIERNCLLITEKLVKGKVEKVLVDGKEEERKVSRWKRDELSDEEMEQIIKDPTERERTLKYWDAVIEEIGKPVERIFGNDDMNVADKEKFKEMAQKVEHHEGRTILKFTSMVEEFAHRSFPYTFGADDLDYELVQWAEGGEHVVGRVFKDAFGLSEGQNVLFDFDNIFRDINMKHDYHPWVEAIMEATQPVRGIHGDAKADEIAYYMAVLFKDYFGKNALARLPFGFGTLYGIFAKESISQLRYGKYGYSIDEQTLAAFVNDLIMAGQIPQQKFMPERSNFFIQGRLKAELGGRTVQAAYDIARSVIPLVLFLIMLEGMREETK